MPIEVQIHEKWRRALTYCVVVLIVIGFVAVIKRKATSVHPASRSAERETLIEAVEADSSLAIDPDFDDFTGKVVSIADGDTVTVLRDREQIKVRLLGIDAPEKGQAFGTAARKWLGGLVAEKTVKVVGKEKDRYGRTLGDIYLDDEWINRELVQEGYAWHFKRYSTDKRLAEAEGEAREKKRGLWVEKTPVAPWEYRKQKREKK